MLLSLGYRNWVAVVSVVSQNHFFFAFWSAMVFCNGLHLLQGDVCLLRMMPVLKLARHWWRTCRIWWGLQDLTGPAFSLKSGASHFISGEVCECIQTVLFCFSFCDKVSRHRPGWPQVLRLQVCATMPGSERILYSFEVLGIKPR